MFFSKQLFLIQTQLDFKTKAYAGYTVSGVITPFYLTVPLQKFLENILGI